MSDGGPRRLGLGAPNEARFGFVQVVAAGGRLLVSGQVGKDNSTGAMRAATSFADHTANAMTNVEESLALAGARPAAMSCSVFVPGLHDLGEVDLEALSDSIGDETPATVVGVSALSSPEYHIEVSAMASGEERVMTSSLVPWPHGRPNGSISDAAGAVIGDAVHLAGHLAWDVDGSIISGTVARQLDACYQAIDRTLASIGLPGNALVAEHVFVVASDVGVLDFDAICDAHREATEGRRPASTLIPVSSLAVPEALACVAAIAIGPIP